MPDIGEIALGVKAAAEVIAAVAALLEDSSRSVVIEVNNATSRTLTLVKTIHDHGFASTLPQTTIAPYSSDVVGAKSGGLFTGVTGWLVYRFNDEEEHTFNISWDVPWFGTNEANVQFDVPWVGAPSRYQALWQIAGGSKKVPARYVIGEYADHSPKQSDWRYCQSCKSLFYGLEGGQCKATESAPLVFGGDVREVGVGGGPVLGARGRRVSLYSAHQASGYDFQLHYDAPEFAGPWWEPGWSLCEHCKVLFWDSAAAKGSCPGREGGHVRASASKTYALLANASPRPTQQNDWRWCDRCYCLFFYPENTDGICPVGGGKHHAHPSNYVLDIAP